MKRKYSGYSVGSRKRYRTTKFNYGGVARRAGSYAIRSLPYVGAAYELGSALFGGDDNKGVAQYHQDTTLFKKKKKRVSRKTKKRSKKFFKAVNKILDNDLPTDQLNSFQTTANSAVSLNGISINSCVLNTFQGTPGGTRDVNLIYGTAYGYSNNQKLYFLSSSMDITLMNTSSSLPMMVDVYKFYVRKDVPTALSGDWGTLWQDAQISQTALTGSTGIPTWPDQSFTPFNSVLGEYITITKKTRHYIGAGTAVTMSMKTRLNKSIQSFDITGWLGKKGWTCGFFVVTWTPSTTASNTTGAIPANTLVVNVNKRYFCKRISTNPNTLSYFGP